ncbi:MAG: DUF1257 domain-containing protein [Verrucomicrobiales bacterium]
MSHFVTIQTQIRDVSALEDACAELGVELLRDAEARGYANQTRHGELVVRLKGPYDIAANRESKTCESDNDGDNGTENPAPYTLTTDWWDGHVEKEVGPRYGRLLQLYGVHKTLREARRKRLRVTRRQETDGSIRLTLAA